MSDERSRLQQAQEVSTAMLDAAEAGQWADVTRLHADCTGLLESSASWGDAERQSLLALQARYRTVQDLASGARAGLATQLGRHRQAYRAVSTYLHSADGA